MSDGHTHAEHYPGPMSQSARAQTGDAHKGHEPHAHHPKLQHHFDDMEQQLEASTLGMWVFLVTEIMFFGGLFMAYLVYRWANPRAFQEASHHLNVAWGAANTVVLIVSSLTMALAVRAAQTSAKPKTQVDVARPTMIFGAAFLGVKDDRVHRQVQAPPRAGPALPVDGAVSRRRPRCSTRSTSCMTGLHALHMVIGLGIMTVIAVMAWRGKFDAQLLHAGRSLRPLLALRRHRLDLPVPAAVPDRRALRRGPLRQSCLVITLLRKKLYYLVFAALIVGTVLTSSRRSSTSGPFNNIVMLAIACTKALLVILFFMRVRWSTRLTWVVAVSGFVWLLIMFGITMTDYLTRGWMVGSLR